MKLKLINLKINSMFGLITKSKCHKIVEGYKHLIQKYEDQIKQLEKTTKPSVTTQSKTVYTTDGSYKNEIWKQVPGTNWKVSNYCRFMDSKGRISEQNTRTGNGVKHIVIPVERDGNGKQQYVNGSDVAVMVHAFNPNSFKLGIGSHAKLNWIDGNRNNKHLSNIIF